MKIESRSEERSNEQGGLTNPRWSEVEPIFIWICYDSIPFGPAGTLEQPLEIPRTPQMPDLKKWLQIKGTNNAWLCFSRSEDFLVFVMLHPKIRGKYRFAVPLKEGIYRRDIRTSNYHLASTNYYNTCLPCRSFIQHCSTIAAFHLQSPISHSSTLPPPTRLLYLTLKQKWWHIKSLEK